MSEYWKSTPKYWCKHCGVFVRDTKLERANHEATGKHQGAVKRALNNLHRDAINQERDKERAKREVERLNGIASGSTPAASSSSVAGGPSEFGRNKQRPEATRGGAVQQQTQQQTQEERRKQLEQLEQLGVAIPDELRREVALAGEWVVTSTRVLDDPDEAQNETEGGGGPDSTRAVGVKRARERTEEEKETEEALEGLLKTKKPRQRRWGVDSKVGISEKEEDEELERLLSMPLGGGFVTKEEGGVKKEEDIDGAAIKMEDGEDVKKEDDGQEGVDGGKVPLVKKESLDEQQTVGDVPPLADGSSGDGSASASKTEPGAGASAPDLDLNAVGGMFKKRKAKGNNSRQK